jgi:predicted NAD-dependent protein-ADP-ribosyltransferase YbiA (DUF1768 family)
MKPSPYKTGTMVKRMGGKKGLLLTPEGLERWSLISIEVQAKICKWKFDAYEEVRSDLLKSGDKLLIHPALRCSNPETRIWEGKGILVDGKPTVIGRNLLGKIWMELRHNKSE